MKWVYVLGVVLLALGWVVVQVPDRQVHVVFCDVGQGDGILIYEGEVQVVIDGGPSEEGMVECLGRHLPFWDRRIEMVVSTHGDKDHIGGLPELVERYEVGQILASDLSADKERVKELREEAVQKGVEMHYARVGEEIRVGDLAFAVLWPPEEKVLACSTDGSCANEEGVVLKFSVGQFEVLLTGDVGKEVEEQLNVGEVEVLKVAHHGSKYSSSEIFLERVRPELAVIAVGKNSYGHPTEEALGRLRDVGTKILRTDESGDIEVVSDGVRWWVVD